VTESTEQVVRELLATPPAEFIARRNEEAKRLRDEDSAAAGRVAKLPKPRTPAWALNATAHQDDDALAALLQLGEQLREAQADLAGDALRKLTEQAHDAVAGLVQHVRGVAADSGVSLSRAATDQVERTLRAALSDADAAAAVAAGLLLKPLSPSGFGPVYLSGAVAAGGPRREQPATHRDEGRRPGGVRRRTRLQQARDAAQDALAALSEAEQQADTAERAFDDAQQRAAEDQSRVEQLRQELKDAERAADDSARELRRSREQREAAERTRRSARRAAERAQRTLDRLS
jgi:hypothetical protein